MAKTIVNKHINSAEGVILSQHFSSDEEMRKGELLICNDPNNPTIYIMDTNGNPKKIAGGEGSGESYDDTIIWDQVNENSNAIKAANESITNTKTTINNTIGVVTDGKTVVDMIADVEAVSAQNAQDIIDNKNIIDEYTINEKKISENPVLDSNDILLSEEYTTLTQPAENVIPGDLVTTAISKLEVMLANTTLALTAAINDLEMKIGSPSSYDENGNIITQATGLYAKYEELIQ